MSAWHGASSDEDVAVGDSRELQVCENQYIPDAFQYLVVVQEDSLSSMTLRNESRTVRTASSRRDGNVDAGQIIRSRGKQSPTDIPFVPVHSNSSLSMDKRNPAG